MAEATGTKFVPDTSTGTLTVTRVFKAPREKVWQAFATPEAVAKWWAPGGWSVPVSKMDFKVGGVWHYKMEGPGGEASWGIGTYKEIEEPTRIVRTDSFTDETGEINPDMPTMEMTFTFAEVDGGTELTMHTTFATPDDLKLATDMGMEQGVKESWDKLAGLLEGQTS